MKRTQTEYNVGAVYSESIDGKPMKVAVEQIKILFFSRSGGDYDGLGYNAASYELSPEEARELRDDLDDVLADVDALTAARKTAESKRLKRNG